MPRDGGALARTGRRRARSSATPRARARQERALLLFAEKARNVRNGLRQLRRLANESDFSWVELRLVDGDAQRAQAASRQSWRNASNSVQPAWQPAGKADLAAGAVPMQAPARARAPAEAACALAHAQAWRRSRRRRGTPRTLCGARRRSSGWGAGGWRSSRRWAWLASTSKASSATTEARRDATAAACALAAAARHAPARTCAGYPLSYAAVAGVSLWYFMYLVRRRLGGGSRRGEAAKGERDTLALLSPPQVNRLHAKLDNADQHGNTALHIAVIHGKNESYRYVRGARRTWCPKPTRRHSPALCVNALAGAHTRATAALGKSQGLLLEQMQSGIPADGRRGDSEWNRLTPLQLAAKLGVKCTQARADAGAGCARPDSAGSAGARTPLCAACRGRCCRTRT